jgi:DEAD/DEAH box helicase domain-containing protein
VLVNGRAVWAGRGSPAARIGLRTGGSAEFRIVDARTTRLLGTVDGERAPSTVHLGALYLHQGQQYRVVQFDVDDRAAWVEAVDVDEYTQVRSLTDVRILDVADRTMVGRLPWCVGAVEVTEQVVGFQRKRISTGAVIGYDELEVAPSRLTTRAFWYEVPDALLDDAGLGGAEAGFVPGTVHAAEHAGIGMLPLFTICDRWDVGGVSTARHEQTGTATVVIYDAYPGGAGIAELGFASGRRHAEATLDALRRCGCASGCPSCVQSPKCGNGNEPLEKGGAIAMLATALAPATIAARPRPGRRAATVDGAA